MLKILKLSLAVALVVISTTQTHANNNFPLSSKGKNKVAISFSPNEIKKTDPSNYTEVRYYYFPNLQAYFDTKAGLYIYQEDGAWVTSESIAPNYRGYSINNGTYVMLKGYTGDEPYLLLNEHKLKYPANYSSKRQPPKTKVTTDLASR
ncbi:hypothetical protein [Flavobacterium psychrotolerans]|uniref:Uncharacterized protein n=1 Tax=Flavobacterium psychrotolerans TaxID=2169410 RepID=A0A2U1JRJ6_9FLAO|nr:hypothetical protein [Flavobacterium psychrotolerans]PWA07448.1 hypothetical protein DB895_01650 [Flavobacterium psychrotolerans]